MHCIRKTQSWADATPEELVATFDAIDDARGMYSVEHFPDSVRSQVVRDFKRHFAGEDPSEWIQLNDGSTPEAVNAVIGLDLARRIASERGAKYQSAIGAQRTLRRIKAAVLGLEGEE